MEHEPLILLVEDEEGISNFLLAILSSNGFSVIHAVQGKEALALASEHCPELILLDLGLPDMDGMDVLKAVRRYTGIPVIVVSARWQEREKVEALDAGADDYVTKPFGTSELLARIRTALRHSKKNPAGKSAGADLFAVGDLVLDYGKRLVTLAGKEIHLTPIEYKIIVLLSRHLGKVLTHDFIMREVWGPTVSDTYGSELQALRVNMANIRRKLEANPAEPRYIVTEVGVGYRMVEEPQQG